MHLRPKRKGTPEADRLLAQMVMARMAIEEIAGLLHREGPRSIAERDPTSRVLQGPPEFYQELAEAIAVFVATNPEQAHHFLPIILRRIEKLPTWRELAARNEAPPHQTPASTPARS